MATRLLDGVWPLAGDLDLDPPLARLDKGSLGLLEGGFSGAKGLCLSALAEDDDAFELVAKLDSRQDFQPANDFAKGGV